MGIIILAFLLSARNCSEGFLDASRLAARDSPRYKNWEKLFPLRPRGWPASAREERLFRLFADLWDRRSERSWRETAAVNIGGLAIWRAIRSAKPANKRQQREEHMKIS